MRRFLRETLELVERNAADSSLRFFRVEEYLALGRKRAPAFRYDRKEIHGIAIGFVIDLSGAGGLAANMAFSTPRVGTITSISFDFTVTAAVNFVCTTYCCRTTLRFIRTSFNNFHCNSWSFNLGHSTSWHNWCRSLQCWNYNRTIDCGDRSQFQRRHRLANTARRGRRVVQRSAGKGGVEIELTSLGAAEVQGGLLVRAEFPARAYGMGSHYLGQRGADGVNHVRLV